MSCNDENQAIINISLDNYTINTISYEDFSLNITNSAFSSSVFRCPSSIHNLTLPDGGGFSFVDSKLKHILVLQNCSTKVTNSSKYFTQISCIGENELDHDEAPSWAVYEEDFNQAELGKYCGKPVEVPYENDGRNFSIQGILAKTIVVTA